MDGTNLSSHTAPTIVVLQGRHLASFNRFELGFIFTAWPATSVLLHRFPFLFGFLLSFFDAISPTVDPILHEILSPHLPHSARGWRSFRFESSLSGFHHRKVIGRIAGGDGMGVRQGIVGDEIRKASQMKSMVHLLGQR
jgi:hypothetical protein